MGKPTIRFEGYTDDWEQRKLDDVVEFLDTMRKPLEGAKRISGPYHIMEPLVLLIMWMDIYSTKS